MPKNNRDNLTKNDISKIINSKFGVPILYAEKFIDDFISIINSNLKKNRIVKIKGFGTFKLVQKKQRQGRNPKNNNLYLIKKREVITFKPSNILKEKINKLQ